MPPGKAAQIILAAMERKASRVFVDRDAAVMDKFYRLNPSLAARATGGHCLMLHELYPLLIRPPCGC